MTHKTSSPISVPALFGILYLRGMSLWVASLNSGSNGNCYYIGNETDAVLVDVGISGREVVKRMKRLGLSIDTVKALFVTHEHGDHIAGIGKLSRKFQLPVYITPTTLQNSGLIVDPSLVQSFTAYEPIAIGGLTVTAFPKYHDAVDPHSFMVANEKVKIGVFTDIGFACRHVVHHFRQCHAAFLESNYDVEMLMNGPYPVSLKNRISNGNGHLSNLQALKLFLEHRPAHMSHLILSHLSRTNNKPALVETLFQGQSGNTQIEVASRNKESKLFAIHAQDNEASVSRFPVVHARQLELF
jgi:phosphoribosyl 1,2-cyclic phosphodiesterase